MPLFQQRKLVIMRSLGTVILANTGPEYDSAKNYRKVFLEAARKKKEIVIQTDCHKLKNDQAQN